MLGSLLDQRFSLDHVLRRGRTGVAYLATDVASGELLAVKVFARASGADGRAGGRFRAGQNALAGVTHPNLVLPVWSGRAEGHWVAAAPYFPAETLDVARHREALTQDERVALVLQAAAGLAALHERGLNHGAIHGGLVPRRVLLSREDGLRVALLGAGRHALATSQSSYAAPDDALFAAPEQDPRFALPVDARADVYALGMLTLHLFCARSPGGQEAAADPFRWHWSGGASEAVRDAADLPAELGPIAQRMLAVAPEERYSTAGHALADLREALDGAAMSSSAPPSVRPQPVPTVRPRSAPRFLFQLAAPGTEPVSRAIAAGVERAQAGQCALLVLIGWDGTGAAGALQGAIPEIETRGGLILPGATPTPWPAPPLGTVRAWLGAFRRQCDHLPPERRDPFALRFDRALSRLPSGLQTIVPELCPLAEGGDSQAADACVSPREASRRRQRMLARAAESLAALAAPDQPLVLWVPELTAMDVDSLQVLRLLLHRHAAASVLVVAGHTPQAGAEDAAVASLLASPTLAPRVHTVALPLLTQTQTEVQVTWALTAAADAGFAPASAQVPGFLARRLYLLWLGTPWAQEQTLRLLQDEGVLRETPAPQAESGATITEAGTDDAAGASWTLTRALKDWPAPGTLEALLSRRLAALDPEAREVLAVASVLDAPFDEDALAARLERMSPPAIVAHVDRCIAEGWLVRGPDGLAFAEPRAHRAVYAALSAGARSALHAFATERHAAAAELHTAAAEAHEGWPAIAHLVQVGSAPEIWSRIAPLLADGSWPACSGVTWRWVASALGSAPIAERSAAAHACVQAALALGARREALALLDEHPGDTPLAEARGLLLRGYARASGTDAAACVRRALDVLREPLPPAAFGAWIARATPERSDAASSAQAATRAWPTEQQAARLALLEAGAELLHASDPHAGDPHGARVLNTRILDAAESVEASAQRLRALVRMGELAALPGGYYFGAARDELRDDVQAAAGPVVRLGIGRAALAQLEVRGAAEALEFSAREFSAQADPVGEFDAALALWETARVTGPQALLDARADAVSNAGAAIGLADAMALAQAAQMFAHALAGHAPIADAIETLHVLVDRARDEHPPEVRGRLEAWLMDLALRSDIGASDTEERDHSLRALVHEIETWTESPAVLIGIAEWRVARMAERDEPADASAMRDALARASAVALPCEAHRLRIALAEAMSACRVGRVDEGLAAAHACADTADAQGARLLGAHVAWRIAQAARRAGHVAWMTWAGKALAEYDALGCAALTERIRRAIESAPARPLTAPVLGALNRQVPRGERSEPTGAALIVRRNGDASADADLPGENVRDDGRDEGVTLGVLCGRVRGVARLVAREPNDWRRLLDGYFEKLEFALSLHQMTLAARGDERWAALAPRGASSAFWAAQTLRPLVAEFAIDGAEFGARSGANEVLRLRTGLGVHVVTAKGDARPALSDAALLVAERLADFSAFLRLAPVVSQELTAWLLPAGRATLRPMGLWALDATAPATELFAAVLQPGNREPGLWSRTLAAYQAQEWIGALTGLQAYLDAHPGDRLARVLMRDCLRRGPRVTRRSTAL
jgi:hypothetical protein